MCTSWLATHILLCCMWGRSGGFSAWWLGRCWVLLTKIPCSPCSVDAFQKGSVDPPRTWAQIFLFLTALTVQKGKGRVSLLPPSLPWGTNERWFWDWSCRWIWGPHGENTSEKACSGPLTGWDRATLPWFAWYMLSFEDFLRWFWTGRELPFYVCAVCCTGFGWDGVNFLQSSPYGPVLWICDQNSVDNTPVFWLLLSSDRTASRLSLRPVPPSQWAGWGWAEAVRGHGQDSWP